MSFLDRFAGPPTEAKFAKILIDALRRAGDDRQFAYDEPQNRLTATKDGKDVGVVNLRNLFLTFRGLSKEDRPDFLKKTCTVLVNRMEMPEDFEDVKADLRPSVRSRSMAEMVRIEAELQGMKYAELPSMPLSEHLVTCLVYDLPNAIRFVNQESLDTWGVTLYEAMEVAKQNLEEQQPGTCGSLNDKLYLFISGDAYDGTRMLMLDMIRGLKLDGSSLALPMTRDCLLVTGSDDVDGQQMMVELAEKQIGEPRPLCSIPHFLNGDEWEPWSPPQKHPHYHKFRRLERHHFGSEYAEQKELLDKRNEKLGVDVFVVTYGVIEFDGEDCSYALWSKGIPSWLPKTDLIAFFDSNAKAIKGFVSWEDAVEELGPMMQPLDYWPPRWFVEEFPRDEQLKAMGARMPKPAGK